MSAILGGSSRLSHDVNPYFPDTRRSSSTFVGGPSSYSEEISPHSSNLNEGENFAPEKTADPLRLNSKDVYSYPTCTRCQQSILDHYLYRIRGQTWHESCAVCSVCSAELVEVCFVHEGALYCRRDYDRLHATRCVNCRQPMRSHELFMRAQYPPSKSSGSATSDHVRPSLIFHVSCFVCSVCQQPLAAGDPYGIDRDNHLPLCRTHFLQNRLPTVGNTTVTPVPPVLTQTSRQSQPNSVSERSPIAERQKANETRSTTTIAGHCAATSSPAVAETSFNSTALSACDLSWHTNSSAALSNFQTSSTSNFGSNKRIRTSLTDEQRFHLQKSYEVTPRPSKDAREALANELGVPTRVVQVWFQNQRARDKRAVSQHSTRASRLTWSRPPTEATQRTLLSQPSPGTYTPSPHTSVESGPYPEFGGFSNDSSRALDSDVLMGAHNGDTQPWMPASDAVWLVGTGTESSIR
ncbi:unnamed protein product [Calicophoron daubneyi]|uniref:Uncharacterized protein n=1 Tax=Calicophoron daubneyi TaxID=300641 RepID=A0AAV2TSN7_CALDB